MFSRIGGKNTQESTTKNLLRIQKLIVWLCALSTLAPIVATGFALYRKNAKAVKLGLVATATCGLASGLAIAGYLANPDRKGKD